MSWNSSFDAASTECGLRHDRYDPPYGVLKSRIELAIPLFIPTFRIPHSAISCQAL